MHIFDIACYAAAIVTVLAIYGSRPTTAMPTTANPEPAPVPTPQPKSVPTEPDPWVEPTPIHRPRRRPAAAAISNETITITVEEVAHIAEELDAAHPSFDAVIEQALHEEPPTAKPARQKSTTDTLRDKCRDAGIKWRNVHGPNRHMSTREMKAALGIK